jgi:hypothetical protein
VDDFPNTQETAAPIVLDVSGSGSLEGRIDYGGQPTREGWVPGDRDWFRFVAPQTGRMVVRQQAAEGCTLDSFLSAYDPSVIEWWWTDNFSNTLDSQVTISVTAGQTYYVGAAGSGTSTGHYTLTFQTLPPLADDFGNDAAGAHLIALAPSGAGRQNGVIETSGDVDAFRFVAPLTGNLAIRLEAAFGSALDSCLVVTDAAHAALVAAAGSDVSHLTFPGNPPPASSLAVNDDAAPDTRTSLVVLPVHAGSTYFIGTGGGSDESTGAYTLTFSGFAHTLPPPPSSGGEVAGVIDAPGQVDTYQFTAQTTGWMTIGQEGVPGGGLDSVLAVFDGQQQRLAFNDDSLGTRDSLVRVGVLAGQTYHVQAGGYDASTGAYRLELRTAASAPFPADLAGAADLPPSGFTGSIVQAGDEVYFRFVATSTGRLAFVLVPDEGLDAQLTASDASGQVLALGASSPTLPHALVRFDTVVGQTYYLRLSGAGATVGPYTLLWGYAPRDYDPDLGIHKLLAATAPGAAKTGNAPKAALAVIPAPVANLEQPAAVAPSVSVITTSALDGGARLTSAEAGAELVVGHLSTLAAEGDTSLVLVVTLLASPVSQPASGGGDVTGAASPAAGLAALDQLFAGLSEAGTALFRELAAGALGDTARALLSWVDAGAQRSKGLPVGPLFARMADTAGAMAREGASAAMALADVFREAFSPQGSPARSDGGDGAAPLPEDEARPDAWAPDAEGDLPGLDLAAAAAGADRKE